MPIHALNLCAVDANRCSVVVSLLGVLSCHVHASIYSANFGFAVRAFFCREPAVRLAAEVG